MSTIQFAKVVASLPGTLEPNTLYLVRTGAGFDLYCSDATGSIAYPVNAPAQIAYPKRSGTPKIVSDVAGTNLSSLTLIAARQYFIPLVVPRQVALSGLRISVSTAATGSASIGIYGNTVVSGNDAPGSLLASVTGLDTGTTGDKTGALSYTLRPGQLYWVNLIASGTPTVRALTSSSALSALGRTVSSASTITHLHAAGSGSTLPDPAPTNLTDGTGTIPAIYLIESS